MKAAAIVLLLGAVGVGAWFYINQPKPTLPAGAAEPTDFFGCAKYYPVVESYPRRCTTRSGVAYTEYLGNVIELKDTIALKHPSPNDMVSSPLTIEGRAQQSWFSDDNITINIKILDSSGKVIGADDAQTRRYVSGDQLFPFEGTVAFKEPRAGSAGLVQIVDPSGTHEPLVVPIVFK